MVLIGTEPRNHGNAWYFLDGTWPSISAAAAVVVGADATIIASGFFVFGHGCLPKAAVRALVCTFVLDVFIHDRASQHPVMQVRPLLMLSEFACQKWPFLIMTKNPLLMLSETAISDNAFSDNFF